MNTLPDVFGGIWTLYRLRSEMQVGWITYSQQLLEPFGAIPGIKVYILVPNEDGVGRPPTLGDGKQFSIVGLR